MPESSSRNALSIADQIAALDLTLFDHVESQTTDGDRRSLLALHDALAQAGEFSYLEIGSHLGGTLQVPLADPRCKRVVSIDSRPEWQPDDRPGLDGCDYAGNSTERMLDVLANVPGADLTKLATVDASTENLDPADFDRPDLCFIDGEHTYAAALRDASFCRALDAPVIVFHDYSAVAPAIVRFLRDTPRPHRGYRVRDQLYVAELGRATLLRHPAVRVQIPRARPWLLVNRCRGDTLVTAAHEPYRRVMGTLRRSIPR
jgi:hypothetical protein